MATSNDNNNGSLPLWMTNSFFEKCLKSGEDDPSITVTSSEVKSASAPGDNYASDMYRAVVQITRGGQAEERSLILKVAKDAALGEISKMVEETNLFQREIDTFTLILPAMHQLLNEKQSDSFEPFGSKMIYYEGSKIIVMEDLKKEGFEMATNTFGLDVRHCLLVMRNIAKYHALSVILQKKRPDLFRSLKTSAQSGKSETFKKLLTGIIMGIERTLNSCPEYTDKIRDKFHFLCENGSDIWLDGLKRESSTFNVLIHGDLWMNNMMFRYDSDTRDVTDVRFVDFQLSYWTTPSVDLLYFLNSSAAPEVIDKFDDMIEEYHNVFSRTLSQFGETSANFTLARLKEEIEQRKLIGVMSALLTRTIALRERSIVPDLNKVFQNDEGIHVSERYITTLKKLITVYEKRGWL